MRLFKTFFIQPFQEKWSMTGSEFASGSWGDCQLVLTFRAPFKTSVFVPSAKIEMGDAKGSPLC